VALAVLCERVDRQDTGLSLYGVVEGFTMVAAQFGAARIFLNAVLRIHAGEIAGPHEIEFLTPDGSGWSAPRRTYPVVFDNETRGWEMTVPVEITVLQPGRFWYELRFDGVPIARLPLEIRHARPD
jgi:hypothetical protein